MGGTYPTTMQGNAGFAKVDFNLSPKQLAFIRISTSRLTGANNVFLRSFQSHNQLCRNCQWNRGCPDRECGCFSDEPWTNRFAGNLRLQFSHDTQDSGQTPTNREPKIYGIMDGFGNPSTLPRNTRENKVHLAETLSYDTGRVHWKFGGDFIQAWIYNYYPYLFDGEYYFDNVKVDPVNLRSHGIWRAAVAAARLCPRRAALFTCRTSAMPLSHPNSRM